jgi:hypothetical protein
MDGPAAEPLIDFLFCRFLGLLDRDRKCASIYGHAIWTYSAKPSEIPVRAAAAMYEIMQAIRFVQPTRTHHHEETGAELG